MTVPVDIRPRAFAGNLSPAKRTLTLKSLSNESIAAVWPDLPPDASLVLLPADDFAALTECLTGQPFVATRGVLSFKLIPRSRSHPPLWQTLKALFWGNW